MSEQDIIEIRMLIVDDGIGIYNIVLNGKICEYFYLYDIGINVWELVCLFDELVYLFKLFKKLFYELF